MPLLPRPNLDYSDRDFAAARLRLRSLARSVFPTWTDFNAGSFQTILLELYAHVIDTQSFYQDAQAQEAFWATVTQRISAIRLGRLIDFRLSGATAATGSLLFTLPSPAVLAETIPVGVGARTVGASPIRYRTTAVGTIPVGASTVSIAAERALQHQETFTSGETPNYEVLLANFPYLDTRGYVSGGDLSSAVVTANEGTFVERNTFLGATADARVFVILVDQDDRARIRFGNGVSGRIPTGLITVTYKTGGGVAGNVEPNRITQMEGSVSAAVGGGTALSLTVTNPAAFSGGTDRMSVETARALAPQSLRSLVRSVTKDDFEVNARRVAGVARTLMATRNEDPAVAENTGRIQIVAAGARLASGRTAPAAPSATMLASVRTEVTVTRPQTLTFTVIVEAAAFADANITTRIYLNRGAVAATVAPAIRAALADMFAVLLADGTANPDIDFGANLVDAAGTVVAEIPWSTIFNAIRDTAGVRKVDEGTSGLLVNGLRGSLVVTARQFPRLGTVGIVNADDGAVL